ncbi:helix-turn-helix domain-containing protein [Moraxella macacae]|nr:helix-turn-helix transcriptional regulator [Moraxella macacae]
MIDFDTIRILREERNWTQEQMAEKLGLSRNGYAKIEAGKSMPNLKRLHDIAELLDVQFAELLKSEHKSIVQIGENYHSNNNYYNHDEKLQSDVAKLTAEIDKLQLILKHQQERIDDLKLLLNQKDDIINALKELNKKDELIAL